MMGRALLTSGVAGAVVASGLALASPAAATGYLNTCDPARATLPAVVEGQPAGLAGGAPGAYFWHEAAGWRLRVILQDASHAAAVRVRGQLVTSRPMSSPKPVLLEGDGGGDWVALRRPGRKVVDFQFRNGAHVDGLDVAAGCSGRVVLDIWRVLDTEAGGREQVPVFVGAGATPVAGAEGVAVDQSATDHTRITVLRTPAVDPDGPDPGVDGPFRNTCRPTRATLPPAVEGAPASFGPGAPLGAYVWHEPAGWRLRVSHPQATDGTRSVVEVGGRVTTSKRVVGLRTYRLEPAQAGEWVALQRPGRKVVRFRFVNGGWVDGFNWRAGCAGRVVINVWQVIREGGQSKRVPLPVFLGANAVPAAQAGVLVDATATSSTRLVILRSPVS